MTQVLSLIFAGGKGDGLSPLTRNWTKQAEQQQRPDVHWQRRRKEFVGFPQ